MNNQKSIQEDVDNANSNKKYKILKYGFITSLLSILILVYLCVSTESLSNSILKSQLRTKDRENIVLKEEKRLLGDIISSLQEEVHNLNELVSENNIEINTDNNVDSNAHTSQPETTTLSDGSYIVGVDIEPGTYNLTAISGYGLLTGDFASGYLSESIGIDENRPNSKSYSGLKLTTGDEFTIKSNVTIRFTPK